MQARTTESRTIVLEAWDLAASRLMSTSRTLGSHAGACPSFHGPLAHPGLGRRSAEEPADYRQQQYRSARRPAADCSDWRSAPADWTGILRQRSCHSEPRMPPCCELRNDSRCRDSAAAVADDLAALDVRGTAGRPWRGGPGDRHAAGRLGARRASVRAPSEAVCSLSEVFGHGLGVVMLIVVRLPCSIPGIATRFRGSWRRRSARACRPTCSSCSSAGPGPLHFDLHGAGLDAFSDWLPMLGNTVGSRAFLRRTPPRPRAWRSCWPVSIRADAGCFPALAVWPAFSASSSQYHFLSDVFWGAAVGCVFAPLCVYGSGCRARFDRLEERILTRNDRINQAFAAPPPRPQARKWTIAGHVAGRMNRGR